jgi:hypothetical protein
MFMACVGCGSVGDASDKHKCFIDSDCLGARICTANVCSDIVDSGADAADAPSVGPDASEDVVARDACGPECDGAADASPDMVLGGDAAFDATPDHAHMDGQGAVEVPPPHPCEQDIGPSLLEVTLGSSMAGKWRTCPSEGLHDRGLLRSEEELEISEGDWIRTSDLEAGNYFFRLENGPGAIHLVTFGGKDGFDVVAALSLDQKVLILRSCNQPDDCDPVPYRLVRREAGGTATPKDSGVNSEDAHAAD